MFEQRFERRHGQRRRQYGKEKRSGASRARSWKARGERDALCPRSMTKTGRDISQ